MKIIENPAIHKKILNLTPIAQKELSEKLNLDRRRISEIVALMLNKKLIIRTEIKLKGIKSFIINKSNGHKVKSFEGLLNGKIFSPCTGCQKDCNPSSCDDITKWICN